MCFLFNGASGFFMGKYFVQTRGKALKLSLRVFHPLWGIFLKETHSSHCETGLIGRGNLMLKRQDCFTSFAITIERCSSFLGAGGEAISLWVSR